MKTIGWGALGGGVRWVALGLIACFGCGDDSTTVVDAGAVTDAGDECACDDGLYCNGVETCVDDTCQPGTPPCEGMCDESSDSCGGDCDLDGDGVQDVACGGTDCDDTDPDRYPGNTEVCDPEGVDEDCDDTTFGRDADGDGYEDADCCNGDECGRDCNDDVAGINPGAADGCGGGDEDCDGETDEEPDAIFYRDVDDDTYGDDDDTLAACSLPSGYAARGGDCSDDIFTDPFANEINPGATEECNARDDDCDSVVDEQPDRDGDGEPDACVCTTPGEERGCGVADALDGVGICRRGVQTCSTDGEWSTCVDAVSPGTEVCDPGRLDEDCDGEANEGLEVTCYRDIDNDDFAPEGAATTIACFCLDGWTANPPGDRFDCDDEDNTVNPGVDIDGCDNEDTDCDGPVDEDGVLVHYRDADGDGYGCGAGCPGGPMTREYCDGDAEGGWVRDGTDCDDGERLVHPGITTEPCDGVDNDCSGVIDDPAVGECGGDCVDGMSRACGTTLDGVGICRSGTQICDGGVWRDMVGGTPGSCGGAYVGPTTDVCNTLDDDCDGDDDDVMERGDRECVAGTGPEGAIRRCCSDDGPLDLSGFDCPLGSVFPVPQQRTCSSCRWNDWVETGSEAECNARFDDCDGELDEDRPGIFGSCRRPVHYWTTTSGGTTRRYYSNSTTLGGWTIGMGCVSGGGSEACYYFSTYDRQVNDDLIGLYRCRNESSPHQYAMQVGSCPSGWNYGSSPQLFGYVFPPSDYLTWAFGLFPSGWAPLMAVTDGQEMFVTTDTDVLLSQRARPGFEDIDHPSSPFRDFDYVWNSVPRGDGSFTDACIIGFAFLD